jgi:hypothetical protein
LEIFASLYTFRFLLMILFTVISTAFAIRILRAYKVNYLFIFELDPNYKIGFMQLLRVSDNVNSSNIGRANDANDLGFLPTGTTICDKACLHIRATGGPLHTPESHCFRPLVLFSVPLLLLESKVRAASCPMEHRDFTVRDCPVQALLPSRYNHELRQPTQGCRLCHVLLCQ